jgi:hypothetical protein
LVDLADPGGAIGGIAGDHLEPIAGSALPLVAEFGEAGEGGGQAGAHHGRNRDGDLCLLLALHATPAG